MKLRSQILIFLFLFALAPLLLLVSINMPLVLSRIQDFYHGAYLQTLRADFRDLDQHLASRQEMLRLLAKLPEPGALQDAEALEVEELDEARARYVEWTNRILDDQLDVRRVVFADTEGHQRFWLERDPKTLILQPTLVPPPHLEQEFFESTLSIQPGSVLVSPIRVDREAGPYSFLSLSLASPILPRFDSKSEGVVYITVDVGGMARAYAQTLWVHDDGSYLQPPLISGIGSNAFKDFPGLAEKFATGRLALWESPEGRQIIWVPMFPTEKSGMVWVGRAVDTSPLAAFQHALVLRGLIVVIVVVLVIWMLAAWISGRVARFGQELTEGIQHMLEEQPVELHWGGTQEVREFGDKLSRLADIHSRNTHNLRVHARELERSNRYKSEFLANVSHELRTPLNSILLLSKMLSAREVLSEEDRHKAGIIHKAGQDLKDLIDNILNLSRIEAGETALHLEPIDLPLLLEELMEMVRPQFEAKGLYLRLVVVDEAARTLTSDAPKIQQIVKNFLSNAVKFTDKGGVEVVLRHCANETGAGPRLCIDVTDTGVGIEKSKQALIFEAFKQADGATNRRYGGTGLGLSISRQLAHLLGGGIEVLSEPGKGATFTLKLPLAFDPTLASEVNGEESAAGSDEEKGIPAADLGGMAVLVMEPDLERLLCLTPMLEAWHLRVLGAQDLDEALEVLADEPQCRTVLLGLDMQQPGACDTLLKIHGGLGEGGEVILVSPVCGEGGSPLCSGNPSLAGLATNCLSLPVEPDQLLDALAKCRLTNDKNTAG